MRVKPQESSFCIDWTVFAGNACLCGGKLCILCFSFFVGFSFLTLPQDCIGGKLCFVAATFFNVYLDVTEAFFSTTRTWLHVEAVKV